MHFAHFKLNRIACHENHDGISENLDLKFRAVLISRGRIHSNFQKCKKISKSYICIWTDGFGVQKGSVLKFSYRYIIREILIIFYRTLLYRV